MTNEIMSQINKFGKGHMSSNNSTSKSIHPFKDDTNTGKESVPYNVRKEELIRNAA
jgi:hypothetical protein